MADETAKLGIQNLKDLVDLPLAGLNVLKQAKSDGKIDFADATLLIQLFPRVQAVIADFGQTIPEAKDLDAAEAAELVTHVMTNLAVDDAKARLIVEKSLKLCVAAYDLAKVF